MFTDGWLIEKSLKTLSINKTDVISLSQPMKAISVSADGVTLLHHKYVQFQPNTANSDYKFETELETLIHICYITCMVFAPMTLNNLL